MRDPVCCSLLYVINERAGLQTYKHDWAIPVWHRKDRSIRLDHAESRRFLGQQAAGDLSLDFLLFLLALIFEIPRLSV